MEGSESKSKQSLSKSGELEPRAQRLPPPVFQEHVHPGRTFRQPPCSALDSPAARSPASGPCAPEGSVAGSASASPGPLSALDRWGPGLRAGFPPALDRTQGSRGSDSSPRASGSQDSPPGQSFPEAGRQERGVLGFRPRASPLRKEVGTDGKEVGEARGPHGLCAGGDTSFPHRPGPDGGPHSLCPPGPGGPGQRPDTGVGLATRPGTSQPQPSLFLHL